MIGNKFMQVDLYEYNWYIKCRYYCILYALDSIKMIVYLGRIFTQMFVRTFFKKYWIKIKSTFSKSGYLPNKIRSIRKSK